MAAMAVADRVLVVNPGSSSLKLSVLGPGDALLAERELESSSGGLSEDGLRSFLGGGDAGFDAAGVRVVHGGPRLRAPTQVSAAVLDELDRISDLAPLHNPPAVAALRSLLGPAGERPVVACFDTAFHASMGDAAALYAVPWAWTRDWGVRRYGFHGLSHAYATRQASVQLGRPVAELQLVTCHLGAGASLAAVRGGVSVDTTMGFTPMEGLVMATRSGSVDPGLLLHVQRHHGVPAADAERMLDRESGLLGVSGLSGDMRVILDAIAGGNAQAALALDMYVHRLRRLIGAMAASLDRVDALVFTGGVGENAEPVRSRAVAGFMDGVPVLVVHAREDVQIAHEVRSLLRG
jgi:acetate kinase